MTRSERLFCYKMTHDTGFAPNPFHGYLTLATCKPQIRLKKRVGDWVAGFTSRSLNGDEPGAERLVYLMRVDEKLSLEHYFADPRFARKKPRRRPPGDVDHAGDNIYWRDAGKWRQLRNGFHSSKDIAADTDGRFVLISTSFAYFGSKPLEVPVGVRPSVPLGISAHGARTSDDRRATAFREFVMASRPQIIPQPTGWRGSEVPRQTGPRRVYPGESIDGSGDV